MISKNYTERIYDFKKLHRTNLWFQKTTQNEVMISKNYTERSHDFKKLHRTNLWFQKPTQNEFMISKKYTERIYDFKKLHRTNLWFKKTTQNEVIKKIYLWVLCFSTIRHIKKIFCWLQTETSLVRCIIIIIKMDLISVLSLVRCNKNSTTRVFIFL